MCSVEGESSPTGLLLSPGKAVASAVAFAFCQACFTVTAKIALREGIPPLFLGGTSMGIGCLLTCLYLAALRRLGEVKQATAFLNPLVRIGLTGTAINVSALFGLRLTTATNAAILTRTDLVFAILLGRAMLKERLALPELLAAVVMLGGALRVLGLELWPDPSSGGWGLRFGSVGDGLVIVSAFFLGLNACQIKRQMLRVHGAVVSVYNTAIMSFLCLLGALFAGEISSLPPLDARRTALILLLGGILFFFFLLYYFSLSQLPVWVARAFVLLAPVFVLGMSAPLLQEQIRWEQVQGMALVVAGGAMMALFLRRPTAAKGVRRP